MENRPVNDLAMNPPPPLLPSMSASEAKAKAPANASLLDLTSSVLSTLSSVSGSNLSINSSNSSFFEQGQRSKPKIELSSGVMYVYEDESIALTSLKQSSDLLMVFDRTEDGAFRIESGAMDEFGPTVINSRIIKRERYYGVLGLVDLQFVKLVAVATKRKLVGHIAGKPVWNVTEGLVRPVFLQFYTTLEEDELLKTSERAMKSVLNSGQLYYAPEYDLTCSLQANYDKHCHVHHPTCPLVSFNEGFLYNHSWLQPFLASSNSELQGKTPYNEFVLAAIYGFVETRHIMPPLLDTTVVYGPMSPSVAKSDDYSSSFERGGFNRNSTSRLLGRSEKTQSKQTLPGLFTITVVSRFSRLRHGGSIYSRGLDSAGNAAAFAETETIVYQAPSYVMSWVQVRGSIPVLWQEQLTSVGLDFYVDASAANSYGSLRDASLHFDRLLAQYGRPIVCIDTIGNAARIQEPLSNAYSQTVELLNRYYDTFGHFAPLSGDLPSAAKAGHPLVYARTTFGDWNSLRELMNNTMGNQGFFFASESNPRQPLMRQTGVYRINDFNCVDETNVVQYWLAKGMIIFMFEHAARQNSSLLDGVSPHSEPGSLLASEGMFMRPASVSSNSEKSTPGLIVATGTAASTGGTGGAVDPATPVASFFSNLGGSALANWHILEKPRFLQAQASSVYARLVQCKQLALWTLQRLKVVQLEAAGKTPALSPVGESLKGSGRQQSSIVDTITSIRLDQNSLSIIGNLFADNGDVIARIYVNTNAYYGHLIRQSRFSYILYPLSHAFLGVSRVYVRLFVEVQRHDVIHTFVGLNAIAVGIATPRIHELKQQLTMIRRHVQRMRYGQPWHVACMFFCKRYFSPTAIHSPLQLVFALLWLMVFWIYRVFFKLTPMLLVGVPRERYLRMPTVRRNSFKHFQQEFAQLESSPNTLFDASSSPRSADRAPKAPLALTMAADDSEGEIPRIRVSPGDTEIPLLRPSRKSLLYPAGQLEMFESSQGADLISHAVGSIPAAGDATIRSLNASDVNLNELAATVDSGEPSQYFASSNSLSNNNMGLLSELATVVRLRSTQADINKQGLVLTNAQVGPDETGKRDLKFLDPTAVPGTIPKV